MTKNLNNGVKEGYVEAIKGNLIHRKIFVIEIVDCVCKKKHVVTLPIFHVDNVCGKLKLSGLLNLT